MYEVYAVYDAIYEYANMMRFDRSAGEHSIKESLIVEVADECE